MNATGRQGETQEVGRQNKTPAGSCPALPAALGTTQERTSVFWVSRGSGGATQGEQREDCHLPAPGSAGAGGQVPLRG